jgi:hypothetical protein
LEQNSQHQVGQGRRGTGSANRCPTLGAYYRRLAQRLGPDIAVLATARKVATRIYRLLRWGQPYVDEGAEAYEQRYRDAHLNYLRATSQTSAMRWFKKPQALNLDPTEGLTVVRVGL